jgi:hypothetical protein
VDCGNVKQAIIQSWEECPPTFNSFYTYEDDLGHILSMSEDEGKILGLQLRMTPRHGNRHAAKF